MMQIQWNTYKNSEKQYLQKWRRFLRWLERECINPHKLRKNKTNQYDLIKVPINDEVLDEW